MYLSLKQKQLCRNMTAIAFLCVMSFAPQVFCHTMEDSKSLLTDKLRGYEKTFRPIANQSAPIALYTALELVSIQEFDEVQEKLTITAVFVLNWIDEYMRWNPDDYGGLTELLIDSDKVWTPHLVLTNNVNKIEKVGDAWQVIRFLPDGTSFYHPGNVFSASCKVDVTYYPWDRHRCGFNFVNWAHSEYEVIFWPSNDKIQTTYFSENGVWTFYDSSLKMFHDNAHLEFFLHLERKPRFVLVNVILPIIFLAYLNTLIFLIPVECGERISYSITVLLALAVFLTLVGDNLPKTSSPMSIFSYYLLTVLVVSVCMTIATIFNVRLYYAGNSKPVKGCLASLTRCMKCNCRGKTYMYNKKRMYQRNNTSNNKHGHKFRHPTRNLNKDFRHKKFVTSGYEMTIISRSHDLYLPERHKPAESTKEEIEDKGHFDEGYEVTWNDVSLAFDKIFFCLSVIILTTATFFLFLVTLLSNRN